MLIWQTFIDICSRTQVQGSQRGKGQTQEKPLTKTGEAGTDLLHGTLRTQQHCLVPGWQRDFMWKGSPDQANSPEVEVELRRKRLHDC